MFLVIGGLLLLARWRLLLWKPGSSQKRNAQLRRRISQHSATAAPRGMSATRPAPLDDLRKKFDKASKRSDPAARTSTSSPGM